MLVRQVLLADLRAEDSNVRRPRMNRKIRRADVTTRATPASIGTGTKREFKKFKNIAARLMKAATNVRVRMTAKRPFLSSSFLTFGSRMLTRCLSSSSSTLKRRSISLRDF